MQVASSDSAPSLPRTPVPPPTALGGAAAPTRGDLGRTEAHGLARTRTGHFRGHGELGTAEPLQAGSWWGPSMGTEVTATWEEGRGPVHQALPA